MLLMLLGELFGTPVVQGRGDNVGSQARSLTKARMSSATQRSRHKPNKATAVIKLKRSSTQRFKMAPCGSGVSVSDPVQVRSWSCEHISALS